MSNTAASVEVLIIGGGVTGSSIAYHVTRQGHNDLVVELNEIAVEPAAGGCWQRTRSRPNNFAPLCRISTN